MFFQLVDRMGMKESGSIVLTSNKDSADWQSFFEEDDALECTLDRFLDRASASVSPDASIGVRTGRFWTSTSRN